MLHIDIPTLAEFKHLAQIKGEICVSLYLPTSPLGEDARVNRVAFKDIAKEALSQLKEAGADKKDIVAFEARFEQLAGEPRATHRRRRRPYKTRVRMPSKLDPHIAAIEGWLAEQPQLTALAIVGRLSEKYPEEFGTRQHSIVQRLLRALRRKAAEQLVAEEPLGDTPTAAPLPGAMDGSGRAGLESQLARPITRHRIDRGNGAIRVTFADEAIRYPRLAAEMIEGNPDTLTDAELEEAAIPILDRLYSRELNAVMARYDELTQRRATTDVSYAAHAATAGAIEQLLVDLDAVIPGLVSDIDGSVIYSASDDAETYSVVDEVARRALYTGARVLG